MQITFIGSLSVPSWHTQSPATSHDAHRYITSALAAAVKMDLQWGSLPRNLLFRGNLPFGKLCVRHQGHLKASLGAQPVAHWRKLAPLNSEGAESPGSEAEALKHGQHKISSGSERHDYMPHKVETATKSEEDEGTPRSKAPTPESQADRSLAKDSGIAVLSVSAGFIQTTAGLCCCIALAKPSPLQHSMAHLETLVQPVWPKLGAASSSWQRETVFPSASQNGESLAEGVPLLRGS